MDTTGAGRPGAGGKRARKDRQAAAEAAIAAARPGPTTHAPVVNPLDLPPLVRRVVERFVRAFAPERIVLFGSYAKGTNHPASDIDLLVVANLDGDPLFHLRRARQLAADCFPPIDVVFAATDDVDSAGTAKSPFLLSILERGIPVYRCR